MKWGVSWGYGGDGLVYAAAAPTGYIQACFGMLLLFSEFQLVKLSLKRLCMCMRML